MYQIVMCMYRACRTIASACGSDNVFSRPHSLCAVARQSHIHVSKDHTTGAINNDDCNMKQKALNLMGY